jgi:urease accessory protein
MLQVFRSLPVASAVYRADTLPATAPPYARDTVTLGWEERLKGRSRRRSDSGVEFATTLPRGTVLREGDCLVLDAHSLVVTVIERAEPVFVVEPRTAEEWGLYGYLIGNSHQPVMLVDGAIVCPDVPGMEQVLTQHDISFSRATRPFTPVSLMLDHRHA